jgi:hypothetical protein
VARPPRKQNDMYSTIAEHVPLNIPDCSRETNRAVEPCRIESLQHAERKSFSASSASRSVQEVENSHAVAWTDRGNQIDLQSADRTRRL